MGIQSDVCYGLRRTYDGLDEHRTDDDDGTDGRTEEDDDDWTRRDTTGHDGTRRDTTGHDRTRRDTTGRTERGYSFIYDYIKFQI